MKYSSMTITGILIATFLVVLAGTAVCMAGQVDMDGFTVQYEVVSQDRTDDKLIYDNNVQKHMYTTLRTFYLRGKVHNSLARSITAVTLNFSISGRAQMVTVSNLGPYENQAFDNVLWETQVGQTVSSDGSGPYLSPQASPVSGPANPSAVLNSFTYENKQGEKKTVPVGR